MAEPYHHAHLWNNCSLEEVTGGQCVLNLTTVSQLIYPITDSSDSGFQPSSAADIRVKMKSRQVIYMVRDDALGESSRHGDFTFTYVHVCCARPLSIPTRRWPIQTRKASRSVPRLMRGHMSGH